MNSFVRFVPERCLCIANSQLHLEAESQAIKIDEEDFELFSEGGGNSSKAICQDGTDKAPTYGYLGHLPAFPADNRSGEQHDV